MVHGFDGVEDDIEQRLTQLVGVGMDKTTFTERKTGLEGDIVLDEVVVQELQDIGQKFFNVDRLELRRRWFGKVQELMDKVIDPFDFSVHDMREISDEFRIIDLLRKIFGEGFDGRKRVFYLMREATGEIGSYTKLFFISDFFA